MLGFKSFNRSLEKRGYYKAILGIENYKNARILQSSTELPVLKMVSSFYLDYNIFAKSLSVGKL